MTGTQWFYWLGKLHGKSKMFQKRKEWPRHVSDAYWRGWHVGLNQVSFDDAR